MTSANEPKIKPKYESSKLFSICEIRPYLYISGYSTLTYAKLKQYGITHAVDATNIPKAINAGEDIEFMFVTVEDRETARLDKHFEEVGEFARQAKNKVNFDLIFLKLFN